MWIELTDEFTTGINFTFRSGDDFGTWRELRSSDAGLKPTATTALPRLIYAVGVGTSSQFCSAGRREEIASSSSWALFALSG
jgi:hypothetical protein